MNLDLVLTYHWFDEIKSGRKTVEYREKTYFWFKRIWRKRNDIKTVTFRRGYTSTSIKRVVTKIDTGRCPYLGWNGEYIRIHFEEL